jgi:hypothetical protein
MQSSSMSELRTKGGGHWSKQEMQVEANWDFTFWFDWPSQIQHQVFQHELKRDIQRGRGEASDPPFCHKSNKVMEWLIENVDLPSDGRIIDALVQIPKGANTSFISDFVHVVPLGISKREVQDPQNDEHFVTEFRKILRTLRKDCGGGKPGRPKRCGAQFAKLSAYRLSEAGYQWGEKAPQKWWELYSSNLHWKTKDYHSSRQCRLRSRGQDKWHRSYTEHKRLL